MMYAAFLFDSDDPKYGGFYGWPIMHSVLGTRILQSAGYSIEIAHGDLPLRRYPQLAQQYLSVTAGKECRCEKLLKLKTDRLHSLIATSTIYAWVLKGIKRDDADVLNTALWSDSAYLGAHEIDPPQPAHRALLVGLMPPLCRINNMLCTLFYSSLNGGERDNRVATELLKTGIVDRIWWEDEDIIDHESPSVIFSMPVLSISPVNETNPEAPSVAQSSSQETTTGRNTHDSVGPVYRSQRCVLRKRRR